MSHGEERTELESLEAQTLVGLGRRKETYEGESRETCSIPHDPVILPVLKKEVKRQREQ